MSELYLVTGGCGFIGSHLCEALLRDGKRVRVLDNLSSGYERNLDGIRDDIDLRIGDVRDAEAVRSAVEGATGVFHGAALVSVFDSVARPHDNHEINITGTFHVLEAARAAGVRRVLLASSAAVYGNDPVLPKVETMLPRPASPYALAKLTGEHMLAVYSALYGVEAVSLRYFNVYGPRQDPSSMYSGVISKFVDDAKNGRHPTVFGDGKQTRDFVFVRDVVRANLLAMASGDVGKGEVFNIATGRSVSLLDLLRELSGISGREMQPEFRAPRPGDIRHSSASIERVKSALGYEPDTGLSTGLRELWMGAASRPRFGGRG
jgi:UDP-glucose 4-epimerase